MSARGEQVRSEIIHILADGAFHSGQQLGERLAISRVAIAKHVATLAQLGLEVHSLTGKGYRLAHPLTLLDEQQIKQHLHRPDTPLSLHHVVGSTNDIVKQQVGQWPSGAVCLAEAQTAGRGRQGKSWLSPFASSLYLSMYWNFTLGYQQISGLSLVVGVAIASTLKRLNIKNVGLKWPNDVYVNGKKIAGVLVELEGQVGGECHAIIGTGLNIRLPQQAEQIDQPWTDVANELSGEVDRNQLCANLINELQRCLAEFESSGFTPLLEQWRAFDYLADQPVSLLAGQQVIEGVARGVNNQGALLIDTPSGQRTFYGGEVSVRRRT